MTFNFPQKAKVFITGGSGFIGGRLIEILVRDFNAEVTAHVNRPFAGALRMARFPIKTCHAPLVDKNAIKKAMEGCSIVFHLAYGKYGSPSDIYKATVNGSLALAEAASELNVDRFVNVSTSAVYGNRVNGVIDERSPRIRWGWSYSNMKLDVENIINNLNVSAGLKSTTIQVSGVYGPWGPVFTITPLKQLQAGRVGLVNEGKGVSNATYVDDVVQALLLAAVNQNAIGETFIVKGPGRITRHEFYSYYQDMLRASNAIVLLSKSEYQTAIRSLRSEANSKLLSLGIKALKESRDLRKALRLSRYSALIDIARLAMKKKSLPPHMQSNPPLQNTSDVGELFLPEPFYASYLSAETEYSAEKAAELLGYAPRYTIDKGMKITEKWARWARIID